VQEMQKARVKICSHFWLKIPATGTDNILGEVDPYLANPNITTTSILKYPCVAEAFTKHNPALRSTAAVKHLFSY